MPRLDFIIIAANPHTRKRVDRGYRNYPCLPYTCHDFASIFLSYNSLMFTLQKNYEQHKLCAFAVDLFLMQAQ